MLLTTPHLLAGIDHLSLDNRPFDPSKDDIERVCRFFTIGKFKDFEKEKGIVVSHSNFFLFVATSQGEFALKFYPPGAAKNVAGEYAINRVLTGRHFLTPRMFAGTGRQPFVASHGRLAACYSYVDGLPAWQHVKRPSIIRRINTSMFSLKKILSTVKIPHLFQKQETLTKTIKTLLKDSLTLTPYDQKATIDKSLIRCCQTYQDHPPSFTRQLTHNNITLTNILLFKKNIYTLDLSHIREDYVLSDLASLVISCLFFNIPIATIKAIAKDYFTQHQLKQKHHLVLNSLVNIGLIGEYLKNIRREKSIGHSNYPQNTIQSYKTHLSCRKKRIIDVLIKINGSPGFIV